MLHNEVLRLLIPLEIGGAHDGDLDVEALALDRAAHGIETVLAEQRPPTAYETIDSWERVYGLVPTIDDPLQLRQNRVVQKMRELGRLDVQYFIDMAAALGYPVAIEELCPFQAGWSGAGAELGDEDSDFCWRVWYTESEVGYYFRAGESCAGENLSYTFFPVMRSLLEELKPAHTFVEFIEA